jgi:[ribosomal protein S5]-alanine N-acetyltransferase
MAEPETLIGHKLSLIPFKEEHISEAYIGWLNNPEVNRFLEVRFVHQTYETVLAYVRSFYGDTEKYMWGIYPENNPCPIGTATLSNINRHHQSGAVGLMIGEKAYWDKGNGTTVIKLVVAYAFSRLNLHKVTAGAVADNLGSIGAFQKAGFKVEGRAESQDFSDGVFHDLVYMGLVNKDYNYA